MEEFTRRKWRHGRGDRGYTIKKLGTNSLPSGLAMSAAATRARDYPPGPLRKMGPRVCANDEKSICFLGLSMGLGPEKTVPGRSASATEVLQSTGTPSTARSMPQILRVTPTGEWTGNNADWSGSPMPMATTAGGMFEMKSSRRGVGSMCARDPRF